MEDKQSNEVLELFAGRKAQSLQALVKMVNNPFWSGLEGFETLHYLRQLYHQEVLQSE